MSSQFQNQVNDEIYRIFKDKYEREILILLNNQGCNSGLGPYFRKQAILDFIKTFYTSLWLQNNLCEFTTTQKVILYQKPV